MSLGPDSTQILPPWVLTSSQPSRNQDTIAIDQVSKAHTPVKSPSSAAPCLAFKWVTSYLWGMRIKRIWTTRRLAATVTLVTATVTAIAVLLFAYSYRCVLTELMREKTEISAAAFAGLAETWLALEDDESLRYVARLMLLGLDLPDPSGESSERTIDRVARLLASEGVLYVQVIAGGQFVVDERLHIVDGLDLSTPSDPIVERSSTFNTLGGGGRFLDITLPLEVPSREEEIERYNYVRLGFDASAIDERIVAKAWVAAGIGVGIDFVVLGLLLVGLRQLHRQVIEAGSTQPIPVTDVAPPTTVRQHGPLRMDSRNKWVTLFDTPIPLTPKQYALLNLLASDAGRVFSDAEILGTVWPGSHYANSNDVKQCVYTLRRRLAKTHADGARIVTNVPGFGYKLASPNVDGNLTTS